MQHGFAADPQSGKIQQIGEPLHRGIDLHAFQPGQLLERVIPQLFHTAIGLPPIRKLLHRRAKPGDQGGGLSAWAQLPFLAAAEGSG